MPCSRFCCLHFDPKHHPKLYCVARALSAAWLAQVSNRPLVPGAALLEATLSAALTLDTSAGTSMGVSLQHASIPAPLLLSKQPGTTSLQARISISCRLGTCALESAASSSASWTAHLQAAAAGCAPRKPSSRAEGSTAGAAKPWHVTTAAPAPRVLIPVAQLLDRAQGSSGWRCHPAAIDSAMHLSLYTGPQDQRVRVPGTPCSLLTRALCRQRLAGGHSLPQLVSQCPSCDSIVAWCIAAMCRLPDG